MEEWKSGGRRRQEEGAWSMSQRKESRKKFVKSQLVGSREVALATSHLISLSHLLPLRFSSMEPNRSLFFICSECGRVCKSGCGLSQHQSVHRALPWLRRLSQDFRRKYHPLLNGEYISSLSTPLYSHIFKRGTL